MSTQGLALGQNIGLNINRQREMADFLDVHGRYPIIQHIRDGVVLQEFSIENGITNEGKNFLFDCMFNAATQVSAGAWCIGLIDLTSYSALSNADTMSSHSGWIEFTGYSQSTRVVWGQGSASGQAVTNGSPVTYDITASTGTLKGIFVTSVTTKGATTGKLWSTGLFNSDVAVVSGDQIKLTYAVAA